MDFSYQAVCLPHRTDSGASEYADWKKIVIHEATTVDGMREQNIDIYYRLIGKIE